MRKEFQEELIKFLVQTKDGKKFIDMVDASVFDLYEHQIIYELIDSYYKEYRAQPSLVSMLQYFDVDAKKQNIEKDVYKKLEETIRDLYVPLTANTTQIRDHIVEFHKRKLTKNLFKDNALDIESGDDDFFRRMKREMIKISELGETVDEEDSNRGEFLLKDYKEGNHTLINGEPTYLKALNAMTSTGGFYSPQLVVLMGAPKSFKTGTLLNIGVNYVRDGYKVYYADCENGQDRIRDRARQCMLECSYQDLKSGRLDKILTEQTGRFKALGGDMKFDFYPAHTKTLDDVAAELEYLKEEFNWEPDLICYDYLDLFQPIDHRIKEKRLQIQAVYFDAIRLQKKLGVFGITLSQVNKDAVNKKIITMKGFAEDFGKAANCHAAFALCGDEDERAAGFIRMVPVAQRDGVAYHGKNVCLLKVDEGRMMLKEISFEDAAKVIDMGMDTQSPEKKKRKIIRKKTIKDE